MKPLASLFVLSISLSAQTITTLAGTGTAGYSGDNGPATQAQINRAVGLAGDASGNLILADQNNHRIRKVDRNGIITTIAGTGAAGFSGDNGPALQAQFDSPTGVCIDPTGNIYVNDLNNHRVRRIATNGTITTIAGNGIAADSSDGGPASAASLVLPIRCAVDPAGNLYIADQGTHKVRKVSLSGTISTVAGTGAAGFSGDGGQANQAALNNPIALATDGSGTLYITDQSNQRIRRVGTNGIITTYAGNGNIGFSGDATAATSASLRYPGGIVTDSVGALYIADTENQRIRKVYAGIITTIAGTGVAGFSGDRGAAAAAQLNSSLALAISPSDNLFIGDTGNDRIRSLSAPAVANPLISSASITNAASFQTGIVPGGMITIFGTNLGARLGQIITPSTNTWPTLLNGIQVSLDNAPAPVYRVLNLEGQEQITIQAPLSLSGRNRVQVIVTTSAGSSAGISVPILNAQPGLFLLDGAANVATHADGSVVTTSNPATRGETVVLYLTGLGQVEHAPTTGQPTPFSPLSPSILTPTVNIGGNQATVSFSGLTPGFISLYQINVLVPNAAPSGSVDLAVQVSGVTSNIGKIPIR